MIFIGFLDRALGALGKIANRLGVDVSKFDF